jgi:hypothetical protein
MKKFSISIIFLVCAVIITVILSIHSYYGSIEKAEKMVLSELSITATETAGKISYFLKNNINIMKWKAEQLQNIHSLNKKYDKINDFYKNMLDVNNDLRSIWIEDKNGIMLYLTPTDITKSNHSIIGRNYSYREYFKTAKTSNIPIVSHIIDVDGINNNSYKTMVIAVPLRTKEGVFDGVLGANININQLVSDISLDTSNIKSGKEIIEMFCLSTNTGIIIDGSNSEKIGKEITIIPPEKLLRFIKPLGTDKKVTKAVIEGKNGKMLVVASSIALKENHTPYAVLISFPYSTISKEIFSVYIKQLILMIFIFITVAIVIYTLISNKKVIHKQKEKIKIMEIQLNEEAKRKSLHEIEETEYFKTLVKKAKTLKKTKE